MANKVGGTIGTLILTSGISYAFNKFDPNAGANTENFVSALIGGVTIITGTKIGSVIGFFVGKELGLAPTSTIDKYMQSKAEKLGSLACIGIGVLAGGYAGFKANIPVSEYLLGKKQPQTKVVTMHKMQDNFAPQPFDEKAAKLTFV